MNKANLYSDQLKVKAKRLDNGEWVTGYYLKDCFPNSAFARHYIYSGMREVNSKFLDNLIEIDPATLCRPLCIEDKNGIEIWERDILDPNLREIVWSYPGDGHIGVGFYTRCHIAKTEMEKLLWSFGQTQAEVSEVIGNTIDHPELLEKSHEHTFD